MAGKMSGRLSSMLSEYLMAQIQSKTLEGSTYILLTDSKHDKEIFERYSAIRLEANKCGFGPQEIFRIYELSNGYILDVDGSVARNLTIHITKKQAEIDPEIKAIYELTGGDLIGDAPEKRRRADMAMFAKYLKSQFAKGKKTVEVALFSKNQIPRISITAKDPKSTKGESVSVTYNAYAIRHWDIEEVNTHMLIPEGIRIHKVEPCEILPSKTGVRFKIHMTNLG